MVLLSVARLAFDVVVVSLDWTLYFFDMEGENGAQLHTLHQSFQMQSRIIRT